MPAHRKYKVVKLIAQPTGKAGPIADKMEPVAGPFNSEAEANRWIEMYREIGTRLAVEPIVLKDDEQGKI